MQLLILILKDIDCIDTLIKSLAAEGAKGGTILEGKGMADEQVLKTKSTIKKITGDLNEPGKGIMFSIPLTSVEGLGE